MLKAVISLLYSKFGISDEKRSIASNAGYLFADKVIRMGIGLLVGIYIARYLGPEQFGLLSYASAFVALFSPIAILGLDAIVVRDIVRNPSEKDEILGSTLTLKLEGGFLAALFSVVAIFLINDDSSVRLLVLTLSIGLIFRAFDTIDLWFQSQVQSKYTVYSKIGPFLLVAFLKIAAVFLELSLIYFAILSTIEIVLGTIALCLIYRLRRFSIVKWRARWKRMRSLLKDCWPLILSGMAIMVDMRIDQIMLGQTTGLAAVGNYAVAVRLSEVWYFIPLFIVLSVFPAVIKSKELGENIYYGRLQKLYDLLVLLAVFVAIPVSLFSNQIIKLLFGPQYSEAGLILAIYVWSGVFVSLGVARASYIISENLHIYHFISIAIGVTTNVLMNLLLIPKYGGLGATIATVVSYSIEGYFSSLFFRSLRRTFWMQTRAILVLPTIHRILKERHL